MDRTPEASSGRRARAAELVPTQRNPGEAPEDWHRPDQSGAPACAKAAGIAAAAEPVAGDRTLVAAASGPELEVAAHNPVAAGEHTGREARIAAGAGRNADRVAVAVRILVADVVGVEVGIVVAERGVHL